MKHYEYIIIGGGISGSSIAYQLHQHSDSILVIDKLPDIKHSASGAAGAFLSPLLGKPNQFKTLVNQALKYSTQFYKQNFPSDIDNCGTTRIPKNKIDEEKFQTYIPYMDFDFTKDQKGYFFKDASVVNSSSICNNMKKNISTELNYEVKQINYTNNLWYIDQKYSATNLILATGSFTNLINQFYINIRPVWGQRIVIQTTTTVPHNYHKECSVSRTIKKDSQTNILSIGATHHRFIQHQPITQEDTDFLLEKANDIIKLENIQVIDTLAGARAASVDYFPLVGSIINSNTTLKQFPYLKHGTKVDSKRFTRYNNLYILNGVGGRGFVLAPYLANQLVQHIIQKSDLDKTITVDRLFLREVKRG